MNRQHVTIVEEYICGSHWCQMCGTGMSSGK